MTIKNEHNKINVPIKGIHFSNYIIYTFKIKDYNDNKNN